MLVDICFSTLNTNLPQKLTKDKLLDVNERTFKREDLLYLDNNEKQSPHFR